MERGSSFYGRDPGAGRDDRARVTNVLSQLLQGVLELLQTCWEVGGGDSERWLSGSTQWLEQQHWAWTSSCSNHGGGSRSHGSRGGEQKDSPRRTHGRGKAFAICSGVKS